MNRKKILIFRFSALGDIAMTIPVIWNLRRQYPSCEILFVSRPFAKDLIDSIEDVDFFSVDFKSDYKGFGGLIKLFSDLNKFGKWDLVADLHNVLRTKIITFLFRLKGVKCVSIDKGRKEKKALCKRSGKIFKPLLSTVERYRLVFEKGGFKIKLTDFPGKEIYGTCTSSLAKELAVIETPKIGIAPFAKHIWKMLPESKMINLISILEKQNINIYLFGGRGEEAEKLEIWSAFSNKIHNLAGKLSMKEELEVMSVLDLMISMDSANMHLASLTATPVISIWGATHPYAGFYGLGQPEENAVQIDMKCRPCSIFGNKPCYRGDFACMNSITEDMVVEKVGRILELGN